MQETTAPQTAMYSEFTGSLHASPHKAKDVKKQQGKEDWQKYAYPNRRFRRAYDIKDKAKYARNENDLKNGVTAFEKMCMVLRDRVEHGNSLHRAFQNENATSMMHYERNKENSCLNSLTAALGNELGRKAYNNNRKLNSIREDKKNNG